MRYQTDEECISSRELAKAERKKQAEAAKAQRRQERERAKAEKAASKERAKAEKKAELWEFVKKGSDVPPP